MKLRTLRFHAPLLLALLTLALSGASCASDPGAPAGDAAGTATDEATAMGNASPGARTHIVATFLAPDLDETGTKELVAALAKNEGVLTAAAVPDSGLFVVTFTGEKTSPTEVLTAISGTNPRLTLRDIAQVSGGSADACGACPSQATCGASKGK